MRLRDWIKANGTTLAGMSRAMGFNKNTLGLAVSGANGFSEELLSKIMEHTKGQVTPNDILFAKWGGDDAGGEGDGLTPDPDVVPSGGHRGVGLHKGSISGALHELAARAEAHGL